MTSTSTSSTSDGAGPTPFGFHTGQDEVFAAAPMIGLFPVPGPNLFGIFIGQNAVFAHVLTFLDSYDVREVMEVDELVDKFQLHEYYCAKHGTEAGKSLEAMQGLEGALDDNKPYNSNNVCPNLKCFNPKCEECVQAQLGKELCGCGKYVPRLFGICSICNAIETIACPSNYGSRHCCTDCCRNNCCNDDGDPRDYCDECPRAPRKIVLFCAVCVKHFCMTCAPNFRLCSACVECADSEYHIGWCKRVECDSTRFTCKVCDTDNSLACLYGIADEFRECDGPGCEVLLHEQCVDRDDVECKICRNWYCERCMFDGICVLCRQEADEEADEEAVEEAAGRG